MSTLRDGRAFAAISVLFVVIATIAAGCGADQALVGGRCAQGYVQCGVRCVDLSSDPTNCGVCGHTCSSGITCIAGECGGDGSLDDGAPAGDTSRDTQMVSDAVPPDSTVADVTDGDASGDDASIATDAQSLGDGDATPGDSAGTDSNRDAAVQDAANASDVLASDADAAVSDALGTPDATDAAVGDASDADAIPPCVLPLVECGGQCIDLANDPLNCGTCSTVCVSQLCQTSLCIGAAGGGLVLIGHDYQSTAPGTSQARVLSNALFESQSNPIRVMTYRRYANINAMGRVNTILTTVAQQLGRTIVVTNTSQDDDIPNLLQSQNYDVLLVHDQPAAPPGTLAALGANWAATLVPFAQGGGVVIVLDGGTGVGQMPAFVTGTTLLTVTAHSPVATGTQLSVTTPGDVVGGGVVSPYAAGLHSVSLTTEPSLGNTIYVVQFLGDAAPPVPVVVHKAF